MWRTTLFLIVVHIKKICIVHSQWPLCTNLFKLDIRNSLEEPIGGDSNFLPYNPSKARSHEYLIASYFELGALTDE
jgi:hypothetical protein